MILIGKIDIYWGTKELYKYISALQIFYQCQFWQHFNVTPGIHLTIFDVVQICLQ